MSENWRTMLAAAFDHSGLYYRELAAQAQCSVKTASETVRGANAPRRELLEAMATVVARPQRVKQIMAAFDEQIEQDRAIVKAQRAKRKTRSQELVEAIHELTEAVQELSSKVDAKGKARER